MANLTRKVLKVLMDTRSLTNWRNDNPVKGIPALQIGTRHTWTDDQLAAFERRWALGTQSGWTTPHCSIPASVAGTL